MGPVSLFHLISRFIWWAGGSGKCRDQGRMRSWWPSWNYPIRLRVRESWELARWQRTMMTVFAWVMFQSEYVSQARHSGKRICSLISQKFLKNLFHPNFFLYLIVDQQWIGEEIRLPRSGCLHRLSRQSSPFLSFTHIHAISINQITLRTFISVHKSRHSNNQQATFSNGPHMWRASYIMHGSQCAKIFSVIRVFFDELQQSQITSMKFMCPKNTKKINSH